MKIDFNRDWHFAKSNAETPLDFLHDETVATETVILPHTWNADDMVPEVPDAYIGAGWYKKTFRSPELEAGQRVVLEFEAVAMTSRVWINETYVGGKNDGYLAFDIDITDVLRPGENRIMVRADNSYNLLAMVPANIDWNRYGGIHRPVWLRVKEATHFAHAGIEVRTPLVGQDRATLTVKTHVMETRRNAGTVKIRHQLLDPDGRPVCAAGTEMATTYCRDNSTTVTLPDVTGPQLWSVEQPVLYELRSELITGGKVVDRVDTAVGFRFFEFSADKGFSLNGKAMKLCGVNQHIFYPGLGSAVPERYYDEEMRLIKKMGCNFFRTSHYPRPQYFLDLCDRYGLLVIAEQPYWHGSVRSGNGEAAITHSTRTIRDLVRQTANHPSVIAWNTVNEIVLGPVFQQGIGHLDPKDPRREAWLLKNTEWPYMRRACATLVDTFKEADPTRPVSLIVGGAWDLNDQAGLPLIADITGYNGGACKLAQEETVHERTGLKFDWPPKVFRRLYPDMRHLGTEGILNHFGIRRGSWEMETEAWKGQAWEWNEIYRNDWFSGIAMWVFSDYSSNGQLRWHCGGAVDRFRLPKSSYHFYRAMWSPEPTVHIVGHWNRMHNEPCEIVVFSNCPAVELTLNGRSLGPGVSMGDQLPCLPNPPRVWRDVLFEPGELAARASRSDDVVKHSLHTHGRAAAVELDLLTPDIHADGRDVSYVTVKIVDADGNLCQTWDGTAAATAEGAARRAGPEAIEILAGLGRFAVRSNGTPGKIRVSVAAQGMHAASTELVAH